MTYQEQTIFSTIYILGQNYRYVAPIPSLGGAVRLEMVFKNDSLYTKLPNPAVLSGCSWIRTEISSGVSQTAPPATLPGARLSCKPGSFNGDIFITDGKICSENDLPAMPSSQ